MAGSPTLARWRSLLLLLAVGAGVALVAFTPFHAECGFRLVLGAVHRVHVPPHAHGELPVEPRLAPLRQAAH